MVPTIPFLQLLQPLQKPPKDCAWSINPGIQRDGSPCSAFLEPWVFKCPGVWFRVPLKAALKWQCVSCGQQHPRAWDSAVLKAHGVQQPGIGWGVITDPSWHPKQ